MVAKELVRIARNIVGGNVRTESLKDIKNWYGATDVTDVKLEALPPKYDLIAVSYGTYGVNGCVYSDKDGNIYKITKRCSNLLRIV